MLKSHPNRRDLNAIEAACAAAGDSPVNTRDLAKSLRVKENAVRSMVRQIKDRDSGKKKKKKKED